MKVIITGGTGLVGQQLQKDLLAKGYQVTVLTRSAKKSNTPHLKFSPWDVQTQNIDIAELCSADHIIHLAGTNVASRKWTKTQKKSIIDSRVQTANFIFNTLKNHSHQVKTFVSASGSNAYGSLTSSHIFKETDGFGNDYLAKVCKQWETATLQFEMLNIRPVSLRTGVVFANKNSALQKMLPPIQMGIGSALGTGKQIMPFIHIKDLSKMYIHALEYPLQGAYNAISDCLSNEVLTAKIAKHLQKPFFFPKVPAFVLKILFGEMATILLEGSALSNTKIKATGFIFDYPNLQSVLKDVI